MPMDKLPVPASFKILAEDDKVEESPIPGRIRSYPYVRGQWTTFPYVDVPSGLIEDLHTLMQTSQNINLFSPEEIHLSLVRGHYVLRHHQIQLFVDELNKKLSKISPFSLCLSTIRLFENDERTRCFICLCDYAENTFSDSHLSSKKVIKDIEDTLNLFGPKVKIPKAQDDGEDPDNFVFHTSIGWCLPDHKAEAIELVDRLNDVLDEPAMVRVDSVKVKIGNQLHSISLNTKF